MPGQHIEAPARVLLELRVGQLNAPARPSMPVTGRVGKDDAQLGRAPGRRRRHDAAQWTNRKATALRAVGVTAMIEADLIRRALGHDEGPAPGPGSAARGIRKVTCGRDPIDDGFWLIPG